MGAAQQALRDDILGNRERIHQGGRSRFPIHWAIDFDFALGNARGQVVRSADLLNRGTVVLTVFRGHW